MSAQIGRGGSGRQLGEIVLHHASVDADNDYSHRVLVREFEVFSLTFFGPLPLRGSNVGVSGLGQHPVQRPPTTGSGVLPAQIPGQLDGLITTYAVYEHPETGLRRVVAHANAGQDGENDDKNG